MNGISRGIRVIDEGAWVKGRSVFALGQGGVAAPGIAVSHRPKAEIKVGAELGCDFLTGLGTDTDYASCRYFTFTSTAEK
jgi:hypothetical protein